MMVIMVSESHLDSLSNTPRRRTKSSYCEKLTEQNNDNRRLIEFLEGLIKLPQSREILFSASIFEEKCL